MKKYSAFLMAILFLFSSCKKLLEVEEPDSQVPVSTVFANDENANAAMVGIYQDMYYGIQSFATGQEGSLSWLAGLSSDELNHYNPDQSPSIFELEQNAILPDNSYVQSFWASLYRTIYLANGALHGLEFSTGMSDLKKNQFKGEALFVRAFCYFYLTNFFGNVPLVLTKDYSTNMTLSRVPQLDVYNQVEKDLLAADSLLDSEYGEIGRVRPNQSAARALLARLYLFQEKWELAEAYSSQIIDQVTTYNLVDNLDNVFVAASKEAIWQFMPQLDDGATYTNEGSYYSTSLLTVSNKVLSGTLIQSFSADDGRRVSWLVKAGTGIASPYLPFKYKKSTNGGSLPVEYSTVFRLAEIYLIRAEARAQQGTIEGENSALSDINVIRNRARLSDTAANDLSSVMGIIERERKLELFMEWGHRWLDLKRWNRATEVLAALKPAWQDTDVLYPVPQSELNKNPNLKPQNSGY